MKRMLFILLALGVFTTALVGCRVEGEIDTASSTTLGR